MTDGGVRKRSVIVAGHRTSVSIEDIFWRELARIALAEGKSVNALLAAIDRDRSGNLSSAIRVYVLETIRREVAITSATGGSSRGRSA
ncbi:MAG: ribbon-helix-helix domain-containing protein [Alphaproteobacteria bacterium]|nr:ribbon-helix-helix domain-containing protein [Alphaproteobacteria bacterium]